MPYEIQFTNSAVRDLKSIEKGMKERIKEAILVLSENPFIGDVKKLRLPFEGYRMRKGDYRILFEIEKSVIVISTIKHRKDVYK